MTEEISKRDNEIVEIEGVKIRRDQVDLIKRTIFIGATDDELRLFFYECARRGTHPMDRLIFPVARTDKDGNRRVTFQTGIDYLRAAAEETGRYRGQDKPIFGKTIKQGDVDVPESVQLTVKRKDPESGEIDPITVEIFWKEYYPGEKLGFMWRDKPHLMLSKCAEAAAFRKAFPRKLGGLYVNEEMERAEAVPFSSSKQPLQEPGKKQPSGSTPPASQDADLKVIGPIVNYETKKGISDGKPWTLYSVGIMQDGNTVYYRTFSETIGEKILALAKTEKDSGLPMLVTFEIGKKGNLIKDMVRYERQPGEDDA
jgi:phage recombination protein Bet